MCTHKHTHTYTHTRSIDRSGSQMLSSCLSIFCEFLHHSRGSKKYETENMIEVQFWQFVWRFIVLQINRAQNKTIHLTFKSWIHYPQSIWAKRQDHFWNAEHSYIVRSWVRLHTCSSVSHLLLWQWIFGVDVIHPLNKIRSSEVLAVSELQSAVHHV